MITPRTEDLVEQRHHTGRTASRVIARGDAAVQGLDDEGLRRSEHARIGASKAVDALLGIADDEEPRRLHPAASARIGRQPALQGMPLQCTRVLELVDQEVAHACIQALLHPGRGLVLGQQRARHLLEIVHVDQAALTFELRIQREQASRKARHTQVILVRVLLRKLQRDAVEPLAQQRLLGQVAEPDPGRAVALVSEQGGAKERAGTARLALRQRLDQSARGLFGLVAVRVALPQPEGQRLRSGPELGIAHA